jgi:hypothetical protein
MQGMHRLLEHAAPAGGIRGPLLNLRSPGFHIRRPPPRFHVPLLHPPHHLCLSELAPPDSLLKFLPFHCYLSWHVILRRQHECSSILWR